MNYILNLPHLKLTNVLTLNLPVPFAPITDSPTNAAIDSFPKITIVDFIKNHQIKYVSKYATFWFKKYQLSILKMIPLGHLLE